VLAAVIRRKLNSETDLKKADDKCGASLSNMALWGPCV